MSAPRERDRLRGFDAVRGLAAVAVVALHAAYPYALAPLPGLVWPVPLDEPSRFADACFWAIEGFVMPLFFTLSGYFLARSLVRQRPGAVLAGRSRRLVISFWTVGIVILGIDLLIWTAGFALTGQATWKDFRRMKFGPAIDDHLWGPGHLWYLEYLWVLCATTCVATWVWRGTARQIRPILQLPPRLTRAVGRFEAPAFLACLLVLAAAVYVTLGFHPEIVLGFQHHFIVPAWPKLVHGGLFLLLGVALFRSGDAVEAVRRFAPAWLAVALISFAAALPEIRRAMVEATSSSFEPVLGLFLTVYAVAAVLGLLGAGVRWLEEPNARLERLAAASFWIYVAHHPICGLLQLALRPFAIPPAVKFGLVTVAAMALCLFSYRVLVENGAVGRMLDGEWPWRAFRKPAGVGPRPAPAVPVRKAA